MRKLLYITLFVTCWCFRAAAQQDTASQNKLGHSYIDSSGWYAQHQQKEKGRACVQKAITIFSNTRSFTDLGYAWWELSGYYDLSAEQFPDKIRNIEQSVDAFHRAGNIKKEADALKELADVRQINGNFTTAIAELKHALTLYQSIGEQNLQGIYDLMGDVSCSLGNLNDAVGYGLQAAQAAEKVKDSSLQLATIYNHLGITYYYLRDFGHSAPCYAKALAIAEKHRSYGDIYIISYNYGNNLIRLGRFEESNRQLSRILRTYPGIDTLMLINFTCSFLNNCVALKQFEAAEQYFRQLNALCKGRQLSNDTQRGVYRQAINYLLKSGRNEEARRLLEQAETYMAKSSTPIQLAENQLSWIALDSAIGDYRSAFSRFRRYAILKDSIYSQEKTRAIEGLNVQYETNKKDQEILLKAKDIELLKQNTRLQSADLANAKLTRNWALAAGALLAIILGLFIRLIQVKQRTNQKLQNQQKEIETKNTSLEQLVNEKEWLVKEIHHRVKNNFHMVIALLGAQSKFLRTNEAIRAITDSQNRVYAMALVHQKLYQSETLSSISMPEYIHDLVYYFREAMDSGRIQFKMDVDHVGLSLTYCTPLGLIINEAITNSVKYAFPDKEEGTIAIAFKQLSPGSFRLTVADDGTGLPAGFNPAKATSMGMRLIAGLSEDLDATLSVATANGTTIMIEFTIDPEDQNHFDNADTRITNAI